MNLWGFAVVNPKKKKKAPLLVGKDWLLLHNLWARQISG